MLLQVKCVIVYMCDSLSQIILGIFLLNCPLFSWILLTPQLINSYRNRGLESVVTKRKKNLFLLKSSREAILKQMEKSYANEKLEIFQHQAHYLIMSKIWNCVTLNHSVLQLEYIILFNKISEASSDGCTIVMVTARNVILYKQPSGKTNING